LVQGVVEVEEGEALPGTSPVVEEAVPEDAYP
jgi:hypothetical protein